MIITTILLIGRQLILAGTVMILKIRLPQEFAVDLARSQVI